MIRSIYLKEEVEYKLSKLLDLHKDNFFNESIGISTYISYLINEEYKRKVNKEDN